MKGPIRVKRNLRKTARTIETHAGMFAILDRVWLAGLGAVAKAQSQGPGFLKELVEEGERVQARTRNAADAAAHGLLAAVQARLHEAIGQLPPVRVLKELEAVNKRLDAIEAKIDRRALSRRARN
jgi:poly(hydroxyalkanoate) granule-associated protein